MERRRLVRYVVWRHVAGWLLALVVLGAAYLTGDGRAPYWPVLLVAAFALVVVTPVLYFLARRALLDRDAGEE